MDNSNNELSQNSYSRVNAVNYAVKYALHPNPQYRYFPLIDETSGDCANFVSQCLRAGGAPMIYNYSNPWWYNNKSTSTVNDDTWSFSWTIAHSLYLLLKENYSSKMPGPKGQEVNTINQLQLGDLVFYEDDKGVIFHSAIVTNFSGIPLISHHSFEALNVPYNRSYLAKIIHLIKVSV